MGVVVGGVILDESVLLASYSPQHENPSLQPVADSLLRKLRHSKIPTGISYDVGLSDDKVSLLKRLATLYSFDCFILNASSVDDAKNEIMLAWGDTGGSILYVVSDKKKEFFLKLSNCSWLIVVFRSLGQESADVTKGGSACENSSMIFINKLEELPSTICHINRKANGNSIMIVGYVMKPSHGEDFAKRGAFPLYRTHNGLIFMPLAFELPLSPQLQEVDMVLHKAKDEIISIELKSSTNFSNRIVCTCGCGMWDLQRYLVDHPDCCVIDSFSNISIMELIFRTCESGPAHGTWIGMTISCSDADREKLSRSDGKFAQYLCKILDVYLSYHHDAYNIKAVDPSPMTYTEGVVGVQTCGITKGLTTSYNKQKRFGKATDWTDEPTVKVAVTADAPAL